MKKIICYENILYIVFVYIDLKTETELGIFYFFLKFNLMESICQFHDICHIIFYIFLDNKIIIFFIII